MNQNESKKMKLSQDECTRKKADSVVPAVEDNTNVLKMAQEPEKSNLFANDGSFMEKFLRMQGPASATKATDQRRGQGSSSRSETSELPEKKTKRSRKEVKNISKDESSIQVAVDPSNCETDERGRARELEFLSAIRAMEDAGLCTERGIGAGMVK